MASLGLVVATQQKPKMEITPLTAIVQTVEQKKDFDTDILLPIWQKQEANCIASNGMLQGRECIPPPPPPAEEPQAVTEAPVALQSFIGLLGYSLPGGNCVDEPGVNNPGWGNPIDWPVLYMVPHIGSTILFAWNHTAVVAGIYPNGDVEVRQRNCAGCPTRYSMGLIRGFR